MSAGLEQRWARLDRLIAEQWWDDDLVSATPARAAADPTGTLLPLPHPYLTAGGSEGSFPELYGWDTWFINLGLAAHGRDELITHHVENQLAMIERYGMVLNGNRSYYLTRSQPPLLADTIVRLLDTTPDPGLAARAARLLAAEYDGYWTAEHHRTPVGLATNRDLGDPGLSHSLAAEAETGLDFTAVFGGDVSRHAPLITNAALVRATEVIGTLTGDPAWTAESRRRADLVRELCWDDDAGFFVEYDVVAGRRRPERSLAGFWPAWAGIATDDQVARMVERIDDFDAGHGLAFTDRAYPSPHPEFAHVQWGHPTLWPPAQIWVCQALVRYGHQDVARRIAAQVIATMIEVWERTGSLWEKYHAGTGGTELPVERYGSVPMHGWSSAAVVVLGRLAFHDQSVGAVAPADPHRGAPA